DDSQDPGVDLLARADDVPLASVGAAVGHDGAAASPAAVEPSADMLPRRRAAAVRHSPRVVETLLDCPPHTRLDDRGPLPHDGLAIGVADDLLVPGAPLVLRACSPVG